MSVFRHSVTQRSLDPPQRRMSNIDQVSDHYQGDKGAEYAKSAVRSAKRAGYWTAFKDECESIVDRIADPMVQEVLRKALAE